MLLGHALSAKVFVWTDDLVVGQRFTVYSGSARLVSLFHIGYCGKRANCNPTQFVEDEGDIVFYKNAHGLAATRPVFTDKSPNDSGVEVDK